MGEIDKHLGRELIGEVKSGVMAWAGNSGYDTIVGNGHDAFLDKVAALMTEYKVDYMWFSWRKFKEDK